MKKLLWLSSLFTAVLLLSACENPVSDNSSSGSKANPAASGPSLSELLISEGTLTPSFSPEITEYTLVVANSVTSVSLAPKAADSKTVISPAILPISNLVPGTPRKAEITATDSSGATTKYTITVLRASSNPSASSDATLKSLTPSSGSLVPAFSPATENYTLSLGNEVTSIQITAIQNDPNAQTSQTSIRITGLVAGTSKDIEVFVVAEDGITHKKYTVTVTRQNPTPTPTPTPSGETVLQSGVTLLGTYELVENGKKQSYTFKSNGACTAALLFNQQLQTMTGTYSYSNLKGLTLELDFSNSGLAYNLTYKYPNAIIYDNGNKLELMGSKLVNASPGSITGTYSSKMSYEFVISYDGQQTSSLQDTENATTYSADGTCSTISKTTSTTISAALSNSQTYETLVSGTWNINSAGKIDAHWTVNNINYSFRNVFTPAWVAKGSATYLVSDTSTYIRQ